MKEGRFPHWDFAIYCGNTLAGNITAVLFYPPTWLMYAASLGHRFRPFKALEYFAFRVYLAEVRAVLFMAARPAAGAAEPLLRWLK